MATRSMPQPPFSTELLADLHADNVTPELREHLWPVVRQDGDALRFVHALDDVSAELRALGRSDQIIHPMPDDIAARLAEFVDGFDLDEEPTETGATIYRLPVAATPDTDDETTRVVRTPVAGQSVTDDETVRAVRASVTPAPAAEDETVRVIGTAVPAKPAPDDETVRVTGTPVAAPDTDDETVRVVRSPIASEPDDETVRILRTPVTPDPEADVDTVRGTRPAAPISLDDHRRSRLRWFTAAAAAVAVVACASIALTVVRGNDTTPTAQPTSDGTQLGADLSAPAMLSALGRNDATGLLGNPAARERCMRANGLERTVLGSNNIRYQGKDAVLILLTGPRTPKITALVVGTGCTTDDPQHLTVQDIG
ncbi:hypothetical protein F3087_04540 [Nocardia colli]|uniref:Uncharacterized protein n=1 Tax=Nocardia colli TaxID=2545717 RepID=A0A5N0EQ83_9NOCA|nr:hypothetical protein [Nocardia colli]KAA8890544.1 hypothetical protein F3087_04540 [Nocardia colli]